MHLGELGERLRTVGRLHRLEPAQRARREQLRDLVDRLLSKGAHAQQLLRVRHLPRQVAQLLGLFAEREGAPLVVAHGLVVGGELVELVRQEEVGCRSRLRGCALALPLVLVPGRPPIARPVGQRHDSCSRLRPGARAVAAACDERLIFF